MAVWEELLLLKLEEKQKPKMLLQAPEENCFSCRMFQSKHQESYLPPTLGWKVVGYPREALSVLSHPESILLCSGPAQAER